MSLIDARVQLIRADYIDGDFHVSLSTEAFNSLASVVDVSLSKPVTIKRVSSSKFLKYLIDNGIGD